jgi:hypothetical protein
VYFKKAKLVESSGMHSFLASPRRITVTRITPEKWKVTLGS